uniref:Uncharacterized protein n=1 Tax=Noctiluca scintillans TaxID=2966 RepID=A0A7S0ZRU8_NOCSC|mmetsp:Transcript_15792/g.43069  ORF Transcript_15792/g.43069 Transcript_15792/m.43069 type:complete len:104 (+) Transcript_15792:52-363(+)
MAWSGAPRAPVLFSLNMGQTVYARRTPCAVELVCHASLDVPWAPREPDQMEVPIRLLLLGDKCAAESCSKEAHPSDRVVSESAPPLPTPSLSHGTTADELEDV